MRAESTVGARSGFGPKTLLRILAVPLFLVACAAAIARAEEAAGTTAPVPAAPAESSAPHQAPVPGAAPGAAASPSPAGLDLEGSYHHRVTRWRGWDVLLGGNLGLFYHANKEEFDVTILPSGRRVDGELLARGLYLLPSVKLSSGEPAPWRYSLGAGAGLVLVDFSTQLEDGMTVDTHFREETLGGYLSVGADRMLSPSSMSLLLRLEAKALFFDLGSLGEFAPGAGRLTGPVFLFQAGIAVAD